MKYINYILIVLGAFAALYAKSGTDQNLFILIVGISMLMIGVYRISKTIPSKFKDDEEVNNNDKTY